jgi:glycosyltransferase involved in cell wall biosynthesis
VRITYVGPVPPIRGGISQHGGNLVAALRSAGHDVDVISWRSQYPRLFFKGEQADVSGAGGPNERFTLRWWNPFTWMAAGRSASRSDFILFPWVTPAHAVQLRTVLTFAGRTPAVVIVHNPRPHEPLPFDRELLRGTLRRVRGAIVHSQKMVSDLTMLAPIPHVLSAPHPPNLALTPGPFPPAPPFKLLLLGFVRPYKGVEIALEAIKLLATRGMDVKLTIAGEFWDPVENWAVKIRALVVEDQVDLRPGYVPDDEVGDLFAAHHALAAPYVSASQSGVTPLAFAAGRPVVATSVGGLPEVVRENETGALAAASSPGAFADAVERVAANYEALGRGALAASASWSQVAKVVLEAAV